MTRWDNGKTSLKGIDEMAKTPETNASGFVRCPLCGADCVPFQAKNKSGWKCSKGDYKFGRQNGCAGIIWNNSAPFFVKKEIARPVTWLELATPTHEQNAIASHLATIPAKRSRLTVINSGPGTGKSTVIAAKIMPTIAKRCLNLSRWETAAFNRHSADDLIGKSPTKWLNINSINGTFGKLQGFRGGPRGDYEPRKIYNVFTEMVKGIAWEDRPQFGNMQQWVDKLRDMLLVTDSDDKIRWSQMLSAISGRFPGLVDRMSGKTLEEIYEYVPRLIRESFRNKKIDFCEQYALPAIEAARRIRWEMNVDAVSRSYEWQDADIEHLAKLIREIRLPDLDGLIMDESQDMSLSQICAGLAATYRHGELILVGDDYSENPYKAGQAIFGWRGAFPGSLAFASRLWNCLTDESATNLPLNLSQRCPIDVVRFVHPLNTVLVSAKKTLGKVHKVADESLAFTYWINADDNAKGLWITRKNAPLAPVFIHTLKARKKVQLRGNGEMRKQIDDSLYSCAGYAQEGADYRVSLAVAMGKLRESIADESGNVSAESDSLENFVYEIGREILADASILREAEITDGIQSVKNLRVFLHYFVDHKANRVLSTVYRSKGDEADYVIIADVDSLNADWNGDAYESAAVRHVAVTRSRDTVITVGELKGCDYSVASPIDLEATESFPIATGTVKQAMEVPVVKSATKEKPVAKKAPRVTQKIKPRSVLDDLPPAPIRPIAPIAPKRSLLE